jgi:superfamily II DNA or RNA helicase
MATPTWLTNLTAGMGQTVATSPSLNGPFNEGLSLRAYQKQAVEFALARRGRALLADDMGLGKSIQALVIAAHYVREWPVLIITPKAVTQQWRVEVLKWFGTDNEEQDLEERAVNDDDPTTRPIVLASEVQVISQGRDQYNHDAKFCIVSHDLIKRPGNEHLRTKHDRTKFKVVATE